MGWSKSTRIKVMLVLDTIFFLLELGVGFAVHSLALMADAFHMVSPPGKEPADSCAWFRELTSP
jgi:zinc transporter 1